MIRIPNNHLKGPFPPWPLIFLTIIKGFFVNTQGNEFQVNTYTNLDQNKPSIAALPDGGWIVTWTSLGPQSGIYGQRYDSVGARIGEEFKVNTYSKDTKEKSFVTSLSDGGWVVTWTSNNQDGSRSGIYAQRYSSDGNKNGAEFKVNTTTENNQLNPSTTALPDGGWIATWTSYGNEARPYSSIYGQRYSEDGNPVGTEFQVNNDIKSNQGYSSLTALSDGSWVITWESSNQDNTEFGIYGQRYSSNGDSEGAVFRINSFPDNSALQSTPSVTALSDGGWVVTWDSYGQDKSGFGVFGQRYNSDGGVQGNEFQINSYTDGDQAASVVTALADGGWVVTWSSYAQDSSKYGIFGQRFSSDGSKNGNEFQINAYAENDQYGPSVAALANGGWVVTWKSDGQDGSRDGIFGQRYSSDGTPLAPNETVADVQADLDRIFNWGESIAPSILPENTNSHEIEGYYARLYSNGFAVGGKGDNVWLYDGSEIKLVGSVDSLLSQADLAGF